MSEPGPRRYAAPLEGDALVAYNMKILRQTARLSQEDLAQRMTRLGFKLHQTQIAKIENGTRPLRFDEVIGLAKALGVPAREFMTEEVSGPDEPDYELREAGYRVQKAEQEWKNAHDMEQGAKARLAEAERDYDEIAERLAAQGVDVEPDTPSFEWYPAPNSPDDPLREGPTAGQ